MASRFIELDCFNVGEYLKCVFRAPDKGTGRCIINLKTASGDIALHHDVRYEWGSDKNALVLNTLCDGSWGSEGRPGGFDFTHGISVKVRIAACEHGFDTYCNEKFISTYKYRNGLTAASVKRIEWSFDDGGAAVKQGVRCHKFKVAYD